MLYPAELRDHIAVHRVIIDKNRRFVNLQAGQRTVGNTEKSWILYDCCTENRNIC